MDSTFVWFSFTKNFLRYRGTQLLFTKFPALLSDVDKLVAKKPPTNFLGSKLLEKTAENLSYFTSHTWHFATHNTDFLYSQLCEFDRKKFPLDFGENVWEIWAVHFCRGLTRYLYKSKRNNKELVRAREQKMLAKM